MTVLRDKRIVITRAAHQADGLAQELTNAGAIPLLYPCLELLPPDELTPLHQALDNLIHGGYDWVIFTSQNTVTVLADVLKKLKAPIEYAAVGPMTAQAASEIGLTVTSLLHDKYTAEEMANALPPLHGAQILLPQSALADRSLATALVERGAHVTAVTAYTMGVGTGGIDLPAHLRAGTVDAITLASPSAFTNLVTRLENEGGDLDLLRRVPLACIGTTTAHAVQTGGFTPTIIAKTYTAHGLVGALDAYFYDIQEHP
jgi:uroporphyrinogen-III synthase